MGYFRITVTVLSRHLILMMKLILSMYGMLCAEVTDISITFAVKGPRRFPPEKRS